jgi:PIN domain nuclease of toxin-antitoxin system
MILLDTHTLLWFLSNDIQLSNRAASILLSPDVKRLISIVSLWEITIKYSLSKLDLQIPLPDFFDKLDTYEFPRLQIETSDLLQLSNLPYYPDHKDPFDRLLIAQSLSRNMEVVSRDEKFDRYGIKRIW